MASEPPPAGGPEAPPQPHIQVGDLERQELAGQVVAEAETARENHLKLPLQVAELKLEVSEARTRAAEAESKVEKSGLKSTSGYVNTSGAEYSQAK